MRAGLSTLDPPDGGWGWMVVMGSFVVNLFVFGFYRAGGIVLLACMAQFDETRSVVAWLPILTVGLSFFMAPLAGTLVKTYSYQQVVFVGGMMAAAGLSVCHFAMRIEHVFLGYGIILGLGFGLALGPNLAIVSVYFRRRRALASGISFGGGAVGTFLVGPLVEFLIDEYGLRGAFLILSACLLHICVAATLFRPLEEFYIVNHRSSSRKTRNSSSSASSCKESPTPAKWADKKVVLLNGSLKPNQLNSVPLQVTGMGKDNTVNGEVIAFADDDTDPPGKLGQIIEINGNNFDFNLKKLSFDALLNSKDEEELRSLQKDSAISALIPCSSNDLDDGRLKIPRIIVTSDDGEAYCPSLSSAEVLDEAVEPAVLPTPATILSYYHEPSCCDVNCDVSLLTNVLLLLVSLSYGLTLAVYIAVMVILPDHVQQAISNSDRMDGIICVSVASAGDLVSRITLGWFVDKLANKKRFLYQGSFFLFGLAVTLMPLACCYWLLLLMCLAMGIFFGTCLIHTPCFVTEYVGVARLPMAMGYLLFFTGLPTLALGPVIGIMRDATGNYNVSLWTMGAALMAGAAIWFTQPKLYTFQRKRDREREEFALQPTKRRLAAQRAQRKHQRAHPIGPDTAMHIDGISVQQQIQRKHVARDSCVAPLLVKLITAGIHLDDTTSNLNYCIR